MKSLIYQFRRAKLAGLLNLLGVVLTLAGTFILLTQVIYNARYNHCIPDNENVYRVEVKGVFAPGKWSSHLSRPIFEILAEQPFVNQSACIWWGGNEDFDKDGSDINAQYISGNGKLLSLLGAQCVDGTLDLGEEDGDKVVIPASLAVKYFGREDVAGQQLKRKYGDMLTVAGVYRDFPANCFAANYVHHHYGNWCKEDGTEWSFEVFIRVKPGTPRESVEKALRKFYLKEMVEDNFGKKYEELSKEEQAQVDRIDYGATPLNETWFSGGRAYYDKGNRSALYMQEFAILLLLLVCIINFANFSMGQAPGRIRSLTIRKVMGEYTWRLRFQLLFEGVVVGTAAWLLSLFVLYLVGEQSGVVQLFTADILLTNNRVLALALLPLAAFIGVVATAYSTWYATSFAPHTAMKGNVGLSPRGHSLRQWLVGLQLCVAMVMVVFMGVIQSQTHYIYHSSYGYAKDSILLFPLGDIPMSKKPVLRQELEKLPGVSMVSFSQFVLGESDAGMSWGRGNGEVHFQFRVLPVEWNYLRAYGIKMLEGRDFKEGDGDVYIINKAMKDQYPGIETGKPLYDGDMEVAGVCDNIRAGSTRIDNSQTALAFVIFGEQYSEWGDRCYNASVRLAPGVDIRKTRQEIEAVLDDLTEGARPDLTFLDDRLEQTYQEENNFIRQMRLAAGLMLIITLIGVFCLTMFETEYRRKEIAIRKVMGSTVGQVLLLFVARYTAPLLVSFVFAVPVGYWLGSRWLENFAEHAPVHWWIFPLALLAVSVVVIVTVVLQSWRVATGNPIDSIKTE